MKTDYPDEILNRLSSFLHTSLEEAQKHQLSIDPQANALTLFKEAAENIPAYRQFLENAGIEARQITTFADFQRLPLTSKANYMQAFPLPDRCKRGQLHGCDRLAVSSGSTGSPTFWPRGLADELDIALRFEQVFRYSFNAHEQSTLAVVCFPLGNWVGGIFTTSCCWHLAQKGYPITVATPGNKPDEILRVVCELSPFFQQTVLLGYPPFIKDTVDTGLSQGVDWPSYNIKFVFAGEVFSEEWRSLVLNRVGANLPCYHSASLYGTADGGVLGTETPLTIAIRRFLASNPAAARRLFGESRLPTLVQYDPKSRFFELIEGKTLAITGNNGVPLIRYHIGDRGGLMSHNEMMAFLRECRQSSLEAYGLKEDGCRLPFVWVFGRADFTVSYYGANIYPENVAVGLEQPELMNWLTGKFVMEVGEGIDGAKVLHIAVELLPSETANARKQSLIAQSISVQLLRLNSEFANYVPQRKQIPQVELLEFGNSEYFPTGVKHRYTRS